MAIKIDGQDLQGRYIGTDNISKVMLDGGEIRPNTVPPAFNDYLCFTANTAGSTIQLSAVGYPTGWIDIETSADGTNWTTYTFGDTITLANIGDKVYWRNTSTTDTGFSKSSYDYYHFSMTGSINGSGNITTLININSTDTLSKRCFNRLFLDCTSLITPPNLPATSLEVDCYEYMFGGCTSLVSVPQLPATTLSDGCYHIMFRGCTSLTALPNLPATILTTECYEGMFASCANIKLSDTQTGEYQTPYRIPSSGTGTGGWESTSTMFYWTGGTFAGTPNINQTYYTSNTVI